MNDLDDLRAALESPPGFTARPLDIGAAMAAGGRIRRRRRLTVGATAGMAVLALLVGGAQLAHRPEPEGRGGQVAATPAPAGRLGDVIRTGITDAGGEWVFYAQRIEEPALPDVGFGIVLGRSVPGGGEPSPVVITNETEGSARSPGFHAVQGAMQVNGARTLTFGYYVGPAEKITATAGRKTVTAGQAVWSEDPSVIVFWFRPDAGALTKLTALDAAGRKLPTGDAGIVVG